MKLLVILLVLALRRRDGGWPLWLTREERHQRFLDRLSPGGGALAWWLAVALPTLLVALLFSWLCGLAGALLTLLLGGVLLLWLCLLYTSPSPRDKRQSRMPSSA